MFHEAFVHIGDRTDLVNAMNFSRLQCPDKSGIAKRIVYMRRQSQPIGIFDTKDD